VSGREIIVTELPYQVGPERVIEAIKKAKDMGKLDEVASVVDLSDRNHGMRLTITVKRNTRGIPVNPDAVLRKLFKVSPLEESFSIHNLALVDGAPRTLTLLQMLTHYVNHRLDVTRRRCEFRKAKAESRAHLLEGFLVALENIDAIVELIRSSRDTDSARNKLMKSYKLSEVQATSILEMPLRRLTSLEVKKIKDELAELVKKIAELVRLLSDDGAMRKLVSDELASNSAKFTVPRRSTITNLTVEDTTVDDVDSVEIEDVPVRLSLTTTGKLGRFDSAPHKGARTKDDLLVASIDCSVRALVGAVTNTGRLLHLHPIDIPACEGKDRGIKIEDALPELARGERVVGFVDAGPESRMIVLATREGFVKRMAGKDMPKKDGQEIIGFKSDTDEVVSVAALPLNSEDTADIVLVTTNAQLLKFTASSVRPQGRTGAGVAGIKLAEGAHVLSMTAVPADIADQVVLTLTDGGNAKWTPLVDYPAKGRAGAGVRCMKMLRTETGLVAARVGALETIAGVAASGASAKLPAAAARRDASGEKVEFAALAGHRP
jgi:DNA gyrase subunit A